MAEAEETPEEDTSINEPVATERGTFIAQRFDNLGIDSNAQDSGASLDNLREWMTLDSGVPAEDQDLHAFFDKVRVKEVQLCNVC